MKAWRGTAGVRPLVVHVEERTGRKTLWLRWWDTARGNWTKMATTIVARDERGKLSKSAQMAGLAAAEKKRAELAGGISSVISGDHLSIMDGLAEAIDPHRGLYPVATEHRKEVERAVRYAADTLKKPWVAVGPQDIQQLWRARIRQAVKQGEHGHRQAQIVVSRLLTVARWLTAAKRIPAGACTPPHKWKDQLKAEWRQITGSTRDPEPSRPRHRIDQAPKILKVAPRVDPRFDLLMWLGLELRLGQVARCLRSDLDVAAGRLEVHGSGHKKGATVILTTGQRAAVDRALTGYLSTLEAAGGDYPLFPQGQLPGGRKGEGKATERHRTAKPITGTAIREWFLEAEVLAMIDHVPGRGAYGLRRAGVDDAADDLDEEALKRFGGWTDSQMPRQVYKDKQDNAADERATAARARFRGESVPETVPTENASIADAAAKGGNTGDSGWAWDELNVRPHAYQSPKTKQPSEHRNNPNDIAEPRPCIPWGIDPKKTAVRTQSVPTNPVSRETPGAA